MTTSSKPKAGTNLLTAPTTWVAGLILLGGLVVYDTVAWYVAATQGAWPLFGVAGVTLAAVMATGVSAALMRRGRPGPAVGLTLGAFWVTLIVIAGLMTGVGVALALMAPLLTAALAARQYSRRGLWAAMLAAVTVSLICVVLDALGNAVLPFRVTAPTLALATLLGAGLMGLVYATALRLLGNPAEAEDVAQTVFLKAFERFGELDGNPSAPGWLKTVATNECLNHLARYRKRLSFFAEAPETHLRQGYGGQAPGPWTQSDPGR